MNNCNSPKQIIVKQSKNQYLLCIFTILLFVITLLASQLGALEINLYKLINGELDDYLIKIWLDIRLPRVLLAILIGSGVAITGAILQGLFRNPLADPGLLGISSGAALMVGVAILIFPIIMNFANSLPNFFIVIFKQYFLMIAAFIGGMTVAMILFLSSLHKHNSIIKLLLLGIAINAISGGVIGLFTYLSNDSQLRQFTLWSMGSLANANWTVVLGLSVITLPAIAALCLYAGRLNTLQLGNEQAYYIGLNPKRIQWQLLLISSLIMGTAVSLTGIIGFVGLVIPHLLRLRFGSDHRFLLPASALGGGIFLLLADTAARTIISPAEMPVGIITSLIGGPYFLYLILKIKPSTN